MLARARLGQGETVAITGAAGGVGTALVQLSLIRGATVVAIAEAAKEERLRALGAHHYESLSTPPNPVGRTARIALARACLFSMYSTSRMAARRCDWLVPT